MARPLNMDTLQQNFWKEEYLKEVMLRFGWHRKYGALVKAKQESQRERHKRGVGATLQLPSVQAPPPVKPSSPPQAPAPGRLPREPEMRPAPREVRALLYQGISHENEGRSCYLKTRLLLPPEDKYTFPVTTNFNYGWQMGENQLGSCFLFCFILFFRKNGAFSLLNPRDVAL
uniref:ATP6V1F neighbor n=1 Tax=Varanus komodoensis TaxID=61221 RepID=A0A8D2LUV7_VARKO